MASSDKGTGGVGALYLADLGYPMLRGDAGQNFEELQDYLFRLTEALRWTLEHLDESNFDQNFFLDFAVGELCEPLPVDVTVSVYRIDGHTVEAVLDTLDGELTTVLWLGAVGTQWHRHVPTATATETADDFGADTLTMTATISKGGG